LSVNLARGESVVLSLPWLVPRKLAPALKLPEKSRVFVVDAHYESSLESKDATLGVGQRCGGVINAGINPRVMVSRWFSVRIYYP